ncbi:BREX-1 system adenine-specific DNA-methyltransferase PglX [Vagococcus fluvialis]|uniref:BREX-1 system adenine-specific DNA-methyltransferase PglX n=1 Tax=Vagococcus fluvialis TaxID=2738 RepID=UPI003B58FFD5
MGSGHILVYAFDVLIQLYSAEGYRERDAAELILQHNLFGLDIDKRAFQLSYFALMMKGRQHSRRLLNKGIKPNIYTVPDNFGIGETELQLVNMTFHDDSKGKEDLLKLINGFKNGNELGSLIKFDGIDFDNLKEILKADTISMLEQGIREMIYVGEILQQTYDISITNPPYMGSSGFNQTLSKFSKKNYPNSKNDLFAMFIERWNLSVKTDGYNTMVTMQSWMFLSSYESMRKNILQNYTISNMMHMENMVMGIAFGTVVTIFRNNQLNGFKGSYHQIKTDNVLNGVTPEIIPIPGNRFNEISQEKYKKIPGQPISYWVSENTINNFVIEKKMSEYGIIKSGIMVNSRYILSWYEVNEKKINFCCRSIKEMENWKWFPLNSGGGKRKWFGNNIPIINLKNKGEEIKHSNTNYRLRNTNFYFKPGITWGRITSGDISFRKSPEGNLFGDAGPMMFINEHLFQILGLSNSKVMLYLADVINPTLNFQVDDMKNMPVIIRNEKNVYEIVDMLIELSKNDWNCFESSWAFTNHPLV